MRRIKFRAWDKRFKKMGHGAGDLLLRINPTDFSEPMQFTGLTDKNGVEIYEGDLFNCIYHRDGCTHHIWEVVYSEVSTCFRLKRHGKACDQRYVSQRVIDVSRYPIIGNIHENPELLEQDDDK